MKRVPISALQVGMFVTGCDRPWMETPFLIHKFLIKAQSQIDKLREAGIQFVDIDADRGMDYREEEQDGPAPDVVRQSSVTEHVSADNAPSFAAGVRNPSLSTRLNEARSARQQMLHAVRGVLDSVHTSGIIPPAKVKAMTEEVLARTLEHDQALIALIRTREFDPDLYDHALSVGTLASVIARLLGYEGERLEHVATAALLHDVGLLRLPRNLLKPIRQLSASDQRVFSMHPQIGLQILSQNEGIAPEVLQIVVEHHDPPAPSRYLDDPIRAGIARSSRLVQAVDYYDELLTGQGGRPPLQPRVALPQLYLDAQLGRLDLEMVSHLIAQIGIYPIYSLVELNSGHRGIVTSVTPGELLRPVVLLTHGPDKLPLSEPTPVNLAATMDNQTTLEIVAILDAEREGVRVEEVLADWVAL